MQIGYGYWGDNVAKKLNASKRFDFAYLSDVDSKKCSYAMRDYPHLVVGEDYSRYIDDVDAVAICTQTQYSYDIAMTAMRAGKHVFIEKPLARSVVEAEKLCEESLKQQIILH